MERVAEHGRHAEEPPAHVRLGDAGVARAMATRKAAANAFFETECSETLRRPLSSGPRPSEKLPTSKETPDEAMQKDTLHEEEQARDGESLHPAEEHA